MTKQQSKHGSEQGSRPVLRVPRGEAEQRILDQIATGKLLLATPIANPAELKSAEEEYDTWSEYNAELLRRIVDTDALVNEYYPIMVVGSLSNVSFQEEVDEYRSDVRDKLRRLSSIRARLELIPEAEGVGLSDDVAPTKSPSYGDRVFIVHGHSEASKQSVARFVEKLRLEAVILHEQPNEGRTIIEKFEDYADVAFAIVLLSPDDLGSSKDDWDDPKPRARQNVIFELGFFLGRLGRNRVSALHEGDVEIPSDYQGVLWTTMDDGGAWQYSLAKEMKAAGMDFDLNRLL